VLLGASFFKFFKDVIARKKVQFDAIRCNCAIYIFLKIQDFYAQLGLSKVQKGEKGASSRFL
jgi:hypothetical protein